MRTQQSKKHLADKVFGHGQPAFSVTRI
jgi:hypothetical protein